MRLAHVTEVGSGGLPVVLLHSLGGSRAHWSAQVEAFGRVRRTLAFDLLGHGENPTPLSGALAFDRAANDVITIANHLGLTRILLVGHSFGSGVAIACAARTPEHIAGLLLADPIGDQRQASEEEVSAFVTPMESAQYEETVRTFWNEILAGAMESTRERVMADLIATRKEVVVSGFRTMTDFDPVTALGAFSGPKLSVTTPFNEFDYSLHRLFPHLPHRRITGTSHWLHMDAPEQFNRIVTEFIAQVGRGSRE